MDNTFIDAVVQIMDRQEISKADMARKLGIDQSTLGKYLNKERKMPLITALDIAKILSLDISYSCGLNFERSSELEKEVLNSLKKVPAEKRTETTMLMLNILRLID